jgi:hypothetical protein
VSHVATVDIEIRDLGALEETCRRLGMKLALGQTTYKWWGRHMGDYPLPAGFAVEDLGKCDHAIQVPDAAYEVGVVRRRDGRPGFQLIWDFVDSRLRAAVGEGCSILKREYAAVVATRQAQRSGFRVQEHRRADGSIQLQLSR